MKLEIPKFRYLAQDQDGEVRAFVDIPIVELQKSHWWWYERMGSTEFVADGQENPNWQSTLIDLEVDDYDFSDGILRRMNK